LADLGNLGFSGYLEKKLFMINYKDYITIDPAIRFGRPCLKGTRISVYDVLNWLSNGMSFEEIQTDFPELTETHIRACLAYAADREHKLRVAV
jgi:uncharacterized protein (DUF433 family)